MSSVAIKHLAGAHANLQMRCRAHRALPAGLAEDVDKFAGWFNAALAEVQNTDLLGYQTRAPYAEENHPTEKHLLPLYVALGAAGLGNPAKEVVTRQHPLHRARARAGPPGLTSLADHASLPDPFAAEM